MKHVTTRAIILRRVNYGEADRILTLLTNNHGKISVIAKGSRKSKSKLAGGLELFCVSDITYIDGKSDLKTVVSTTLHKNYTSIAGDMDTTMIAYDFLKHADKATEETCEEEYFDLLHGALKSLSDGLCSIDMVRLWFRVHLLRIRGVALNLDHVVDGVGFTDGTQYQFSYEDMGFYESEGGQYKPAHIKFLRLITKVTTPENILKVTHSDELASDLKQLIDHCLKLIE